MSEKREELVALAEDGAGEPVAWIDPKELERALAARGKQPLVGGLYRLHPSKEFDDDVALYTAPAADQGVAVSVEELAEQLYQLPKELGGGVSCNRFKLARALLDKYSIRSALMTEGK